MAGISASDVNASIPLGAKPPQIDPLEIIGAANKAQTGLLQNRLLQQEVAGKIARGKAAQGAIDPTTGQFDPDQFVKNLAASPDGAQSAPEAVAAAQQNRIAQIQQHVAEQNLTQEQIKTSQMENANAARIGQSLLGNGVTSRDGISQTLDTVAPTLFKTPEAMQQVAQFKAQLTDDPAQNAKILQHFIAAHTDVATALGEYKPTDTGGRILQTRTNPATGQIDVGGGLDKSISPESAAELVDVVGTDGAHYKVPKSTLLGGSAPGGASPAAGGGGNGRYPGAPGAPRGAVATSALAPGTPEIMAASAKAFTDDTAAVPSIRKTLTTFDQAMQAIKNAPTGSGSDKLQNLRGLAETYGIPLPKNVKDEAEAYQEFSKWSSSALAQESSRLGLGTDQARQIQAEAQPGTHTIHDAAVKMLPILKGLKAMDLAAPVIFQASGLPPQQYNAWRATWANGVDPLAFGAGSMTKDQRRALIDKMSPDEQKRYAAGLKAAIQAGVFSKGDLAK